MKLRKVSFLAMSSAVFLHCGPAVGTILSEPDGWANVDNKAEIAAPTYGHGGDEFDFRGSFEPGGGSEVLVHEKIDRHNRLRRSAKQTEEVSIVKSISIPEKSQALTAHLVRDLSQDQVTSSNLFDINTTALSSINSTELADVSMFLDIITTEVAGDALASVTTTLPGNVAADPSVSITSLPSGNLTAIPLTSTSSLSQDTSHEGKPIAKPVESSLFTESALTTQATTTSSLWWQLGANAIWSPDCDFQYMGDYKQVSSTAEQCDPACSADIACTHFSWYKGTCYLKMGGATLANAQARNSGLGMLCGIKKIDWKDSSTCSWALDCDFPHIGDYKQVSSQGERCDPLCASDSKCTHFVWSKGTCYLKTNGVGMLQAKRLTSGSGAVCGIKKAVGWQQESTMIWAHSVNFYHPLKDYKKVSNQPVWNCGKLCEGDSMCTHFTHYQGTCYLKKGGAYMTDASAGSYCCVGKFSGIKRLFDRGFPNLQQWMTSLPDRTELSDMLIPGTHDSAAGNRMGLLYKNNAQCQDLSIGEQLNNGIRYFDLRVGQCEGQAAGVGCMYHGKVYCGMNLNEVVWDMYHFLQRNPGEVILAKFSNEGPYFLPNFVLNIESVMQGHHEWYHHPGITADWAFSNLQLGYVRGKIIPFWRDTEYINSEWGLNFDRVVNYYPRWTYATITDAQIKFLERAFFANEYEDSWIEVSGVYQQSSTLFGEQYPRSNANKFNPMVTSHLFAQPGTYYGNSPIQKGLVPMDFPTSDMWNQIITICRKRQFSRFSL